MTTDEKAKAYEMALEGARKELGVDRKEWEVVQQVLHNIFPELRESEDERIRKEIISFIEYEEARGNIPDGWHQAKRPSEWIAWLEKQKESLHISETCKKDADSFTDEDKRMMKNIRLALLSVDDAFWATHGLTAKEAIAYLEKQKEPDCLEKFIRLPHLNSDYEVVDDWAYTPSLAHCDGNWGVCWVHCEDGDTLHECIGDTPAEAIDKAVEWFTSLEKPICAKKVGAIISSRNKEETACGYLERCLTPDMRKVWYEACDELKKACFQEAEKQKEHQNNSDAPNESSWSGIISSSDKDKNLDELAQDYVDGVKEYNPEPTWDLMQTAVCYGYHLAGQKEQKPASAEDMPYITDEHFFEREPVDSFKYKLAEYMTKCCTKKEGPYGYEYGISAESILEMAKEELIKRGELKEQKPAELSEEEKMHIELLVALLREKIELGDIVGSRKQSIISWLKSLRPSWKLSEDEERLINTSISFLKDFADKGYENAVECIDWLKSKLNGNSGK